MQTTNTPLKIFFTGATGYIGGTVLAKLLASPQASNWTITALTRNKDTVQKLQDLGVTPLVGSLDDAELLKKAVTEADITIHAASAQSLPGIKAITEALATEDGKRRILLHTSGTALLVDNSRGDVTGEQIYSDLDIESIRAIPVSKPHKDVDNFVLDNYKGFDSITLCPPTIYGIGLGQFKRHSNQIPRLIRTYVKHGAAATVGKGVNIWNNIHVEDLADFYVFVLEKALEGKAQTGKDGWHFVETGEHHLKDVVAEIGKQLFKHKAIKQEDATQFTPEEVEKYLGPAGWISIGSNSRSSADRAKALGWKPSGKKGTVIDSIAEEVETLLAEEKLLG